MAEISAHTYLKYRNQEFTLFYKKDISGKNQHLYQYTEIDPLLGWTVPESDLNRKGLNIKNNCALLRNISNDKSDSLIVFITGGSTSDLALFSNNWPSYLFKKFSDNNINVVIYNGAIAGYGSSQEFLKFIRDGLSINPHIYISYSGANEFEQPYYTSTYTYKILENYKNNFTRESFVLPNLIFFIKKTFKKNRECITLKSFPDVEVSNQWLKNFKLMHQISQNNDIKFLGVIQPVAGISHLQPGTVSDAVIRKMDGYQKYYPDIIEEAENYDFLHDFSGVFKDVLDPFIDDCHVKDEFQYLVADSIFYLIQNIIDLDMFK